MDVRHRIIQFNNGPKYDQLRMELDKLGASYKIEVLGRLGGKESRSIEFIVSEDDSQYPVIAELIRKYDFYTQTGVHYTKNDISNAEWVIVTTGEFQYPQPESITGFQEASFDTSNYCKRCGMGLTQVRPIRLKRDFKQKQSQFLGLHWLFDVNFARPVAKLFLEKHNISGIEFFHPVYHKTGEDIENVYQIFVQTIAQPGLVTEGLSPVTCKADNEEAYVKGIGRVKNRYGDYPYCGRVKYHHPRTQPIRFRRDSLGDLPDIAKSFEYFRSGAAAHKLVLMRGHVVKLIQESKLRGMKFTPVELV